MSTFSDLLKQTKDQQGAVAVIAAILIVVLISVAALAIDIGHLTIVRGELKNAACAGALAGALDLYEDEGEAVNPNANQKAYYAAIQNKSEKVPVELECDFEGNSGDVQRGHWSFTDKIFTPNSTLVPVSLEGVTSKELDQNLDFVNAVKVTTRRNTIPAASFFARIFGYQGFTAEAESVAYRGFAGTILPGGVDQPIAICQQAILEDNKYDCNVGRMINSGVSATAHNTAGWTNFTQPCSGAASSNTVKDLVCKKGNPKEIDLGKDIETTNGNVDAALTILEKCWTEAKYDSNGDGTDDAPIDTDVPQDGWPDKAWNMTLPVIDCPGGSVSNCAEVVGAVNVDVVWIQRDKPVDKSGQTKEKFPEKRPPWKMEDWSSTDTNDQTRWASFVEHFNLQDVVNNLVTYDAYRDNHKSIYFKPDCSYTEPKGKTGGKNFGVLAKIPVLVK